MKKRYYLLLVFLGVAAILAGWIYESRLGPAVDRAELAIPDNIDYYLTDLNYRSMTENGDLDFAFNSPRLEHRPLTDTSHIDTPMLQILRNSGNWQIDSRQGEFVHAANLLRLHDRVIMRRQGQDPLKILGQSITFEPDADRITSESRIVIESNTARIEAEHAVFELNNNIYLLRKARAVYDNVQG